jgi:hypothetical protein
MRFRVLAATAVLFLFPLLLPAQVRSKILTALRIEVPIEVDGLLSEEIWSKAPEAGDFVQFQPDRGAPGTEKTLVRVLYDSENIYFGFLCYDAEPGRIAASITKRDSDLVSDDAVYVALDTFLDHQSAYLLGTNLLGTQFDGRITDNGRTTDPTWDAVWKSAARKTDFGWSAEIAVPFRSIKYKPGEEKTWGFSLGRFLPRKLEYTFWTGPLESYTRVSQFGELHGLDLQKSSKRGQIIPHIVSQTEVDKGTDVRVGLDARYAFTPQISGNLTLNPDFAMVEADQEVINLTRFETYLPEKRTFFLEGAEIYQQRISLFYSRRIGDIYGGAKAYGKSGGYEFQAMTVQAKPVEDRNENSANFSVFRVKKAVMRGSTVGFLLANKYVDGRNKGTLGFDTALYFTDTIQFTGQLAASYGDTSGSNLAFFLRPSYDTATFHIHLRYTQLGEHFADNANEVGFVRDDNRREFDSALSKTWWMRRTMFNSIEYDSNYNIYWGLDGTLRSWKIDQGMDFELRNKFTLELGHHQEYKLYEKDFRNHKTDIELGYNTREWQNASVSYSFGHNFDLDFHLIGAEVNYMVLSGLSLEYGLSRLIYEPDPEAESTWIHVLRATNHFTPDLYFKLFYQVHTAIDKHTVQALFVYRFQPPFGTIQLAYQKGTAEFGEKGDQGHTFFVKFAYMF